MKPNYKVKLEATIVNGGMENLKLQPEHKAKCLLVCVRKSLPEIGLLRFMRPMHKAYIWMVLAAESPQRSL